MEHGMIAVLFFAYLRHSIRSYIITGWLSDKILFDFFIVTFVYALLRFLAHCGHFEAAHSC